MYFKCSGVPFQGLRAAGWQGRRRPLAPLLSTASERDLLPPERHARHGWAHVPPRAAG